MSKKQKQKPSDLHNKAGDQAPKDVPHEAPSQAAPVKQMCPENYPELFDIFGNRI